MGIYHPDDMEVERIVSLVPSWTEFVARINPDVLVGRTNYCIYPPNIVTDVSAVGGTKNPDVGIITELNPDLVIANKEENKKIDIQKIRAEGNTVLMTSAIHVYEAIEEMFLLEQLLVDQPVQTQSMVEELQSFKRERAEYSFLYLVWYDPVMVAGKLTYISNLVEYAGGKNIAPTVERRYPRVNTDFLGSLNPDYIFLPDEPFEFLGSHKEEIKLICPESKVILLDGKLASWYNHRLIQGLNFFSQL